MARYNHDMMHCSQHSCKKKDQCYRYWLGQEIKKQSWQIASFFMPATPVKDGCEYFINLHEQKGRTAV